jgi:signal transduction histidine kinase
MRRSAPFVLVALGLTLLLGWYVAYTRRVVVELREEAARSARMYARVYRALSEPGEQDATAALLDLSAHIGESGVPLIVTDARGRPTATKNLPFSESDTARVRAFVATLDRENTPVVEPGVGTVHYGHTALVNGLRVIPLVQATVLGLLLVAGTYALRTRGRAEREKVWAGMARESAHQLGTPLTSLSGWIELLTDRAEGDPLATTAITQMRSDLDRLERVAHRFERIGRPPRRDVLDVGALAQQVAAYFRARVPTLARAVVVSCECAGEDLTVRGDPVLVEWAAEVLVKNAIDALAGRGGRVEISATRLADGAVRLRVADDGPGVPRELRTRIFSAGFSTKERGWGVGLSLAKRIVEENHGGRLLLTPSDRGATFDVILP